MENGMKFLLLLVLSVACQIDQAEVSDTAAKTYNVEGKRWTRTTSSKPRDSINPKFVPNRTVLFFPIAYGETPLSECVAVDVDRTGAEAYRQWLADKVDDLINGKTDFPVLQQRINNNADDDAKIEAAKLWLFKTIADTGFAKKTRDYRRPSIIDNGAKVLCVSIYDPGGDRLSVNMFSFWDGQKAKRVGCIKEQGDFVCRDINDQEVWRSSNFGDSDFTSSVNSEIRQASFDGVNTKGRVKVVAQSLKMEHRAFNVYNTRSVNEYSFSKSGNTKNFTRVVLIKNGENVLRPCDEGRSDEFTCKELGVKTHAACQYDGAQDQTYRMCKLSGRGMLIMYSDDDILRVATCKYHKEALHFYCSDSDTVYFERYGVEIIKPKPKKADQGIDSAPEPEPEPRPDPVIPAGYNEEVVNDG